MFRAVFSCSWTGREVALGRRHSVGRAFDRGGASDAGGSCADLAFKSPLGDLK